jgi:hypothetical protein
VTARRPIFRDRSLSEKIGYVEGNNAYDLANNLRCRYDETSGNLFAVDTRKVVGHISLEGRFAGLSWIAEELFPASAEAAALRVTSPATSAVDQPNQLETAHLDSTNPDIERALENLRVVLKTR